MEKNTKKSFLPDELPFGIPKEHVALIQQQNAEALLKTAEDVKLTNDEFLPIVTLVSAKNKNDFHHVVLMEWARVEALSSDHDLSTCFLHKVLDLIFDLGMVPLYLMVTAEATMKEQMHHESGNIMIGEPIDILIQQTFFAFNKSPEWEVYVMDEVQKKYVTKAIDKPVRIDDGLNSFFEFYYKKRNYYEVNETEIKKIIDAFNEVLGSFASDEETTPQVFIANPQPDLDAEPTLNGIRKTPSLNRFFDDDDFLKRMLPSYIHCQIKRAFDTGFNPVAVAMMLPPSFTKRNAYLYVCYLHGWPGPIIQVFEDMGNKFKVTMEKFSQNPPEGIPDIFLDLFPKQ